MEVKNVLRTLLCVMVCGMVSSVFATPVADHESSDNSQDLDGDMLQDMAKELEKPMLQLIGKAIEKLENRMNGKICDRHPCSPWEEWSGCHAHASYFGAKFRTRKCGVDYTACDSDTKAKTRDTKICLGYCPDSYNITENGLCMKLYDDVQKNRSEAELQCEKDGGHLININSWRKYRDVKDVVDSQQFTSQFWIDGHRSNGSFIWEYENNNSVGFYNWGPGAPSNGEDELCLAVKGFRMLWNDVSCSDVFYTMCEVVEH